MAFSLLPKQEKFYTFLLELSGAASVCAKCLKTFVESSDPATRQQAKQDLLGHRARSKEMMNLMTNELCHSFITPFDREDIQRFAEFLYRIPKTIEKAVQRMELHGLVGAQADFGRQIALIVDEAQATEEIVIDLINRRNTKKILEKVALLHQIEQRGDDVLQELLGSLFAPGRDTKDLMLRKDIYDLLEKVIDGYRNAAAVTLQIVMKYS